MHTHSQEKRLKHFPPVCSRSVVSESLLSVCVWLCSGGGALSCPREGRGGGACVCVGGAQPSQRTPRPPTTSHIPVPGTHSLTLQGIRRGDSSLDRQMCTHKGEGLSCFQAVSTLCFHSCVWLLMLLSFCVLLCVCQLCHGAKRDRGQDLATKIRNSPALINPI